MTSGRAVWRGLALGLLALVAASSAITSVAVPSAQATSGTWGATQAEYVDGTVCTDGGTTSPLASWNFGDDNAEYLLSSVTSNGVTDSASLPYSSVPGRSVTAVSPGQYGFTSDTDVSTYAALISLYSAGPGAAPAEVARAVLDASDPGQAPNCVSSQQAQPYLTKAAALAGPYELSLTAGTTPATLGAANSLNVQVTSTAGTPVTGAKVTLTGSSPVFGNSSTATAVTGADGTAHAPFTIGAVGTLASVSFTASASVSVGLEAATVSSFGGTSPYVGALYADPPTTYTSNLDLPIQQSAQPAIAAKVSSTAIAQGSTFTLGDAVTGLYGHAAHLQFTVLGPVALVPGTLCSTLSSASWNAPTAATGTADTVGDATVDAGTWMPSKSGCYRLSSTITTTDASPESTASAPNVVLTVVDTEATLASSQSVYPTGPFTQKITVTHSYSRPGVIATQVLGPLTPGNGNCEGVDWDNAKRHSGGTAKTTGDGTFTVSGASLSKPGCYQLHAELALSIPGSSPASIPLTDPSGTGLIFVLHPSIAAQADLTSVASPASVGTQVTILNTYGQAGTLQLLMYESSANELGCRDFALAKATLVSTGPATPFTGDGTVRVRSAATSKLGCYALVPKLVMKANPAVTVTGSVSSNNIILAGFGNPGPPPRPEAPRSESRVAAYVSFGVLLLIVLAASVAVIWYFLTTYRDEDEAGFGIDLALGS